jgi:hypothetical protein
MPWSACDYGKVLRLRRNAWPADLIEAVRVAAGRRDDILAAVELADGTWVAGTRSAVYLPEGDKVRRVGWELIERAGWNSEESILHVYETTPFGTPLRATDLAVDDPGRFGQLLRERIDASVLVQRHVPLVGKKGVRIVGRRNPAEADAPVSWNFVLDKGLQPDEPGLIDSAEDALRAVREEFGI